MSLVCAKSSKKETVVQLEAMAKMTFDIYKHTKESITQDNFEDLFDLGMDCQADLTILDSLVGHKICKFDVLKTC